ncbi:type II secretion system protein GspL [Sandarakinorhabdus sp.]|uniref:type II secretion system protein GspL n=1 Tax=Sandarakinorhabdus sp. TaxID=1916663 RepID=UPI0033424341
MIVLRLAPAPCWQRWEGDRLIAAGAGWPPADPAVPLVLAVPGEAAVLHWLGLPDLAPAQAAAAARLALADQLGEADAHIAVASHADPVSGQRAVAVVARADMAGWLAELARRGLTASRIIPDPLLLPLPAAGWAVLHADGRVLARRAGAAFAAEADLAALLIGDDPVVPSDLRAPADDGLDLLTGDFARSSRWQTPAHLWRQWAMIAAAAAGIWLAGDAAALLRARSAASAADADTLALARPALPAGADDAAGALAGLKTIARQRGADGGLAALAAPVVQALAQRQGAGLASLTYTPSAGLVAGVAGGPAEAQALAAALGGSGLTVTTGATRAAADTSITDVTVQQ